MSELPFIVNFLAAIAVPRLYVIHEQNRELRDTYNLGIGFFLKILKFLENNFVAFDLLGFKWTIPLLKSMDFYLIQGLLSPKTKTT